MARAPDFPSAHRKNFPPDALMNSKLMKLVSALAISPAKARLVAEKCRQRITAQTPGLSEREIQARVLDDIAKRYAKRASLSGGGTALASIVPGIGTAVTLLAGGSSDLILCAKLEIDMILCLCMALNGEKISDEEAKRLAYVVALAGMLEKNVSGPTASPRVSGLVSGLVKKYLARSARKTAQKLLKTASLTFAKKSFAKALPFGVGVGTSAAVNYALMRWAARQARSLLERERAESGRDKAGRVKSGHEESGRAKAGHERQLRTS